MPDIAALPLWNRFAHWPRRLAQLTLVLLAALLVLSAFTPVVTADGPHTSLLAGGANRPDTATRERDVDLQLYDRVTQRVRSGQNYYDAVAIEHRATRYPLRPGFSVRLPTLAVIEAQLPPPADPSKGGKVEGLLASLLAVAIMVAWWRRLGEEPGGRAARPAAALLLLAGVQVITIGYFFVLHELWAGGLLALALGLHRPERGKWLGALIAAAAAIAIREHALPFVLLMAAFALWHRRWREGAAWAALIVVYIALIAWHLHTVAGLVRPGDPLGASWLTLRGLSGWLSMIVLSSNLRFLPAALAGPLIVLMLLGWAGWRTGLGAFATLLFLGYGLAFMVAGRIDNWYWGMTIALAMWAGLAFVPMALKGLCHAAWHKPGIATAADKGQV